MGSVQNFFTSRDNNTDPATYVGQLDRLWYNPVTNSIFVSDGNTAGGKPVDLAANANAIFNNVVVTGNISVAGNISPASNVKIGGVRAGPGANIGTDGLLTIDTTGLPLSFGDFTATGGLLTLTNVDENMTLQTLGSAEIQLVGNVGFYKPDGYPPATANRYFQATDDGQITILVPSTDSTAGAVKIIGSSTGNFIAPGQPGAMLQITGQLGTPSRLYQDGNGEYVAWVARRWNGNVAAPTQVLANEDVLRINATAASNAGVGNVAMAQISMTALENQTTAAQGSQITFTTTPVGSPASARVAVANITVANGVNATKFTTSGTVSATGNVTGGNIVTAGLVIATGNVTGANINGFIHATAGTTSAAPINLVSGSLLTSSTAGTMEYDGNVVYATPINFQRGVVRASQTYVLQDARTYTTVSGAQASLFGVGANVANNVRYIFKITTSISKNGGGGQTLSFGLGGTATLGNITYQSITAVNAVEVYTYSLSTAFSTGNTIYTTNINAGQSATVQINGVIDVAATGAGTLIPTIGWSAAPGNVTVGKQSVIELYPVGVSGANTSVGTWT